MAVILITDSGCDLNMEQAQELGVSLVPMTVHFGGEEFRSGVNLTNEEFYNKLVASKELPTTSQPTPFDFGQVFQQVKANGDEAVVLCISSVLSGTYQSAVIAADDYEDCVHVVDTYSVSVGQRILLEYALRLRDAGMDAQQIARVLEEKKNDVYVCGAVETLEYLIKGGRLSKAAGTVGSMLGIRPVLKMQEGALAVAGKARGPKAAMNMTLELIKTTGVDHAMPFGVGYTGNDPIIAKNFLETVGCEFPHEVTPVYQVGSTAGTHAGPGLCLAAFFRKT